MFQIKITPSTLDVASIFGAQNAIEVKSSSCLIIKKDEF
jgi:hypothetical protein